MKKGLLYVIGFLCIFTLVGCDNKVKLSEQDIKFIYNEAAYVVETDVNKVDVILSGDKAYVERAIKTGRVVANLSKLERDETKSVTLVFESDVKGVKVEIEPSKIDVTLKTKVSEAFELDYSIVNEEELDEKLSIGSVELSEEEVIVRGTLDNIEKLDSLKALVDINVLDIHGAGEYTLAVVEFVGYDAKGKVLENIEVVGKVSARIKIDSYSKLVPVVVRTTGDLITGKAISSILVNGIDYQTIIIYGKESDLASINMIEVFVDVHGLGNSESKEFKITIPKPKGVSAVDMETLTVKMQFGEAKQMSVTMPGIQTRNLSDGLVATLVSVEDKTVDVQVIGVEDVLNNLDINSINAYVDLQGLDVGTHTVEVKVESMDSRLQFIVTKKINIVIAKR